MNRSYSKIRHIQEVNKMLENRILMEAESNFDDSSLEPTQQELSDISNEPEAEQKRQLGEIMFNLYSANNPPSNFSKWLDDNGYKKLVKRLDKLKEKVQEYGEGVLTSQKMTWLGGKYFTDKNLRNNVDRIKKEHLENYKKYHTNP